FCPACAHSFGTDPQQSTTSTRPWPSPVISSVPRMDVTSANQNDGITVSSSGTAPVSKSSAAGGETMVWGDVTINCDPQSAELESGTVLSIGSGNNADSGNTRSSTPAQNAGGRASTGDTTMNFSNKPRSQNSVSYNGDAETVIETQIETLSNVCRVLTESVRRGNLEIERLQLEVAKDGIWQPVLAYELTDEKSVRHEYLPDGRRETMNIDLPAIAAQEMIQNDLTANWRAYSKRFLAGRRISS
ncbi:MAG TPA: hypothetical protein V6C72_11550, partial [Chroococcales cyanobacterium]